ncbi:hypothetical protein ACIQPQ_25025 [Streptomyces sp. NPDC091281]
MNRQEHSRSEFRNEDWLRDLPRLLEERNGIPRARATELTTEAANHLIATGRSPVDEFGPVEVYALKLAEQEKTPRVRWWLRDDVHRFVIGAILAIYLVQNIVTDGPVWQTALAATALAIDLTLITTDRLRKRR